MVVSSWVLQQFINADQDTPCRNDTIQLVLLTEACQIKLIEPVLFMYWNGLLYCSKVQYHD